MLCLCVCACSLLLMYCSFTIIRYSRYLYVDAHSCERKLSPNTYLSLSIHIYIYIYVYTYMCIYLYMYKHEDIRTLEVQVQHAAAVEILHAARDAHGDDEDLRQREGLPVFPEQGFCKQGFRNRGNVHPVKLIL